MTGKCIKRKQKSVTVCPLCYNTNLYTNVASFTIWKVVIFHHSFCNHRYCLWFDSTVSRFHTNFLFHFYSFHQPHPDSSRAMMEASVPCSVATPSVAEQFRDEAVLPSAYLTPTERRNNKGA